LPPRPPRRGAAPWRKVAIALVAALVLGATGITAYAAWMLRDLPDPGHDVALARTIVIYDAAGKIIGEHDPEGRYHLALTLAQMGKNGPAATLAAEDRDFYRHGPISFTSLARAVLADISTGRAAEGGSTITQQLVKIELLGPKKSISRKVREAFLAWSLEQRYSKDQVLTLYLNRVYYGHGAYGLGSAAKTYFGAGTEAAQLSPAKAAFLAGLLNAPSADDPFLHYDRARSRELYVLKGMVDTGALTQAEADQAAEEPISKELKLDLSFRETAAPHFVDYVVSQLEQQLGAATVHQGGLSVYTTLDSGLQAQAVAAVQGGVAGLAGRGVNNGDLLAARPATGEILAWVGSADYQSTKIGGQYDVVLADRQPGSSFKPYVYAAALRDHRITLATPLHDVPTDFGGYRPLDYDNSYQGTLCARAALVHSRNIPVVEAAQAEGIGNVITLAREMGIRSDLKTNLQTAIGGSEVTLLDQAQAYQVLANQGQKVSLKTIRRVADRSGNTIFEAPRQPAGRQVLGQGEAYLVTDALKDYQTYWQLGWNRQMASKTGTNGGGAGTSTDAWIMAYNPDIVVGAWLGHTGPDGANSTITAYGENVGQTVMKTFVNNLPAAYRDWYRRPAGLVQNKSGELLLPGTESMPSCTAAGAKPGGGGGGAKEHGGGDEHGHGDGD